MARPLPGLPVACPTIVSEVERGTGDWLDRLERPWIALNLRLFAEAWNQQLHRRWSSLAAERPSPHR